MAEISEEKVLLGILKDALRLKIMYQDKIGIKEPNRKFNVLKDYDRIIIPQVMQLVTFADKKEKNKCEAVLKSCYSSILFELLAIKPTDISIEEEETSNDLFFMGQKVKKDKEKNLIKTELEKVNGNRTKAAEALGVSRRTLLYRIKEYGIK